MFTDMIIKFGGWILGILAIIGTLVGIRQSGVAAGKKQVETEATEEALERAKKAKEVEREVSKMDSSQLDDYLDRIMRDKLNK